MRDFFLRGGPIMWPLLLCSLTAMTISLERALFWWREQRRRDSGCIDQILAQTESGGFDAAAQLGRASRDPVAQLLAEGLAHRSHGLSEALQMAAQQQLERMRRGISVLDTIVTVSPLLGILGTVAGVIGAFESLGGQQIQDPAAVRVVTAGIAQALITTAAGLAVAIPSLVVYNGLLSALRRIRIRMEQAATALEVAERKGRERAHAPG